MKKIVLTSEERKRLTTLSRCRTASAQEVQRAKILILRADGMIEEAIAEKLDITRKTVYLTTQKYHKGGIDAALRDEQRSGRPASYTDSVRAAIINTACQSPKTLGLPQEVWSVSSLTDYINAHVVDEKGDIRTVSRSSVGRTLHDAEIKPHKIKYYCEKRDPDFDEKMNNLLVIYKQIQLQFDDAGNILGADEDLTVTLSYDEKPGIQAIANTSPDLPPQPTGGCITRDYEYKRLNPRKRVPIWSLLPQIASCLFLRQNTVLG